MITGLFRDIKMIIYFSKFGQDHLWICGTVASTFDKNLPFDSKSSSSNNVRTTIFSQFFKIQLLKNITTNFSFEPFIQFYRKREKSIDTLALTIGTCHICHISNPHHLATMKISPGPIWEFLDFHRPKIIPFGFLI